jgi:phosphatidylglycerol---prolipoprotein diacylglyceryl transferase
MFTSMFTSMFTLAAHLHTMGPFLFEIGSGFGLRWYGLSYTAGFVIGWLVLRWLARRGVTPIPEVRIADMMMYLVVGVIVGGRLGYVLIYEPKLLLDFSSAAPWWGVLAIYRGGMAYHGAVVGVMFAGWLIARGFPGAKGERVGASTWRHVMDLCAFASTMGLGLGRVANYINGELLGRIVAQPGQPSPWWSVKFPQELLDEHGDVARSPQDVQQIQELVNTYAPQAQDMNEGIGRVIHLLQSGSPEVSGAIANRLEPLLAARHPSQLYQAFFEGVVLTAVLWWVWRVPRRPGVVGCWFLITYGVLRIVAEFFRLPDAQFATGRPLGLSRGQWLSVCMVVGGVAVLAWIRTLRESPTGGWRKPARAAT